MQISTIKSQNPEKTSLIVQIVDITEQRRLMVLKDDFVATVSHELRTPLAAIHGSLRLLEPHVGDNFPAKVKTLFGMANRNTKRLIQVVDDLLDFQRISKGRLNADTTRINMSKLVEEVVLDNENYAEKYGVKFELSVPDQGVFIEGDDLRLRQIIANLLSNASKFSPRDGVVEIKVQPDELNCMVYVSDTGRGVSSEFGKRIFQPFSQQADALLRDVQGSGLGLAISKGLVELMSGEIGYESKPHVRTTFWVKFPLSGQDKTVWQTINEEMSTVPLLQKNRP